MQISTNTKGLQTDVNISNQDKDAYSFVLNGVVDNYSEENPSPFISNNFSNLKCLELSKDEKIIGYINLPEYNSTILAVYNEKENKQSFLKYSYVKKHLQKNSIVSECSNRIIIHDNEIIDCKVDVIFTVNCFKWDMNKEIQFQYKVTNNTINLYFVNGYDEDRYIYLNEDFTLTNDFKIQSNNDDCNPIYLNELDCNTTLFNPKLSYPCLTTKTISGGSLKEGLYSYLFAYANSAGQTLSEYSSLSVAQNIFSLNTNSTAAIEITVGNLQNERWRYFNIVRVQTIKEITTYHLVGTYPISRTKVIDEKNEGVIIPLEQLIIQRPYYKSSNTISVSSNTFFKAGLTTYEEYNLQPIVNSIEVEWVTTLEKEGIYKNDYSKISYLRDEVYAFALEFHLDNQETLPLYPLVNSSLGLSKTYTAPTLVEGEVYEVGNFGVYTSTETYPNFPSRWNEYCNTPIKHFKFPDHKLSTHFTNDGYIKPIGVRIKSDINNLLDTAVTQGYITQEQRSRIIGWKLVRSSRLGNKSIVAKGLLYDMWKYNRKRIDDNFIKNCPENEKEYYYPNYPFNDLNADRLLTNNRDFYFDNSTPTPLTFTPSGRYTFHSPSTSFSSPELGENLKAEAVMSGKATGNFNVAEEQARYKLLSEKIYSISLAISKYLTSNMESPSETLMKDTFSNFGESLGSTTGLSSLGALGGVLGGFIGKGIYNNNVILTFIDGFWKNTILYAEVDKFVQMFQALMKYKEYFYQYQAVGDYDTISSVNLSEKSLLNKEYLGSSKYIVDKSYINNLYRESSIYLQAANSFPLLQGDNSRVLISDNATDYSETKTITEQVTCKSYSIRRAGSSNTKLSIWGVLCTPIFFNDNVANYPIGTRFSTNSIQFGKIILGHNTIENIIYEIKEDGKAYVVEELIYAIKTGCLSFCQKGNDRYNVKNPSNITLTACYEKLQIRDFRADDQDEIELDTEGGQQGVGNIEIKERSLCEKITRTYTYTTKGACDCNKEIISNISSYYASIKNNLLNQYGTIYDISWVSTTSCLLSENQVVFGGDTFINRFTFKRKHSFFKSTPFKLPNGTDFNFSEQVNVANPIYYFDTQPRKEDTYIQTLNNILFPITGVSGNLINSLIPVFNSFFKNSTNFITKPKYNFDCSTIEKNSEVSFNSVSGLMYLYYYGIPSFLVESEINLDCRDKGIEDFENFYPNVDLDEWLQEKNVPIAVDNSYLYRQSYSKENKEFFWYLQDKINNKLDVSNRVVYSLQGNTIEDSALNDNYLVYRPLDYFDFDKKFGKVISIDSLESDIVLVRQEKTSNVYKSYIELNTDNTTSLLYSSNLFQIKPMQFSNASLGYLGSQHKAILHTPYGHIIVDSTRGQIFNIKPNADGLEELSVLGMKNWFKENLPFHINKYFNVDIDSNFNGVGIALCYDNRFNSFYLTKLDYIPKDDVTYKDGKYYFEGKEVQLKNKKYFENKSWTISYNFFTKTWASFHSFIPNFYIEHVDHFDAGLQNSIWKHNITNKSYLNYFGKQYPFIVEIHTEMDMKQHLIKNVSFLTTSNEYINQYDYRISDETFNKAVVYNREQNSGLIELELQKQNNLQNRFSYPIFKTNSTKVDLIKKEEYYSFNKFKDRIIDKYSLVWMFDDNNVNKHLRDVNMDYTNKMSISYITGLQNKVRLIFDNKSNIQLIFKSLIINDYGGYR